MRQRASCLSYHRLRMLRHLSMMRLRDRNAHDTRMIIDPYLGWVPKSSRWAPSPRYLLRRRRIMSILARTPAGRYLEVGCGAGALLAELQSLGFESTGLETAEPAFQVAAEVIAESGEDVNLVRHPSAAWGGSFNVVAAFDVLEHVQDDTAVLREWVDWLAGDGILLLSVPAHPSRWGAGDVWAGHFRRYRQDALIAMVEATGLRVDHIECYGFPTANLTEMIGELYYRRALRRRATVASEVRNLGNALSGVDRGVYRKVQSLMTSKAGKGAVMLADALQTATAHKDWGSGYLLSARRA